MITLSLHGDPTPSARPRLSRFGAYDPQQKIKEGSKWQLRSQYREPLLLGPLIIDISFYMPIPKSTSKKMRTQMQNGIAHHIKKPDIDNLQKFVLDCLNGIVIEDDSQIIEIRARKIYSSKSETLIRLKTLEDVNKVFDENYFREAR